MDKDNKFDFSEIVYQSNEYGLITTKKIYIPAINFETEIWINKERKNQVNFSQKQKLSFEKFLRISKKEMSLMQKELEKYAQELIQENKITKKSLKSKKAFDLEYRAIIVPQQSKTPKNYILVLADTKWKIKRSEYVLEVEILFENNEFSFLQEYAGLWTRLEWNDEYNIKENV
ncbi:hypothetical protein WAF17_20895 [Bernardetia sp. ABR2-2B]|uniref:hypothetical protein n=1 Tax=Bernardetia sp. ABR2-2B TaxID=3127472 RepID=UPI0030CE46FE